MARIRPSNREINVRDQLEIYIQIRNDDDKEQTLSNEFHFLADGEKIHSWTDTQSPDGRTLKPGEDFQVTVKFDHQTKLPTDKTIQLLIGNLKSPNSARVLSNEIKIKFFQTW